MKSFTAITFALLLAFAPTSLTLDGAVLSISPNTSPLPHYPDASKSAPFQAGDFAYLGDSLTQQHLHAKSNGFPHLSQLAGSSLYLWLIAFLYVVLIAWGYQRWRKKKAHSRQ